MGEARTRGDAGPRGLDGRFILGVEHGMRIADAPAAGAVFGEFTVLRWERQQYKNNKSGYAPICRCVCGWEGAVAWSNIKQGRSTRCNGCAKQRSTATRMRNAAVDVVPRGRARRSILARLSAAINRCHNPNDKGYINYGARGITVCHEWRECKRAFLEYISTVPGWDAAGLDMDRIDNDRGYEPGNIRFVSRADNTRNRRTVKQLERRVADLEAEIARLRSGELRAT